MMATTVASATTVNGPMPPPVFHPRAACWGMASPSSSWGRSPRTPPIGPVVHGALLQDVESQGLPADLVSVCHRAAGVVRFDELVVVQQRVGIGALGGRGSAVRAHEQLV